ncbi:phosphatidylserine decarboxylase-domain-containing protein [Sordaria brevicollis]|uniref:Phosphatidylserine decarboxylase-domain-containing protein n=1 Tax=Sordaria brevicollis TaxID=83679 RepID=A0AAE0UER0_SORBR|nr:phosphatidylserine decarboxylase-domain-containing protein [Sordaria brevicollis]
MIQQVPHTPPYDQTPFGGAQTRNWKDLLYAFNDQLSKGPIWLYDTPGQLGLIGFPFNALLNWSMSTPAGLVAFHRPNVNSHLRNILTAYGDFLTSPASAAVLNSSSTGWLSPKALEAIVSTACQPSTVTDTHVEVDTSPRFHHIFISNPQHPTHGFLSWDAFITRRFQPGIRPIASPSDDGMIVNACESTPVALSRGVKLHAEFWVKGQPYSLMRILGGDQLGVDTDEGRQALDQIILFEGGTIYQGFLGALSYHRWHAPVAGVVEKVRKIEGTYFAGCPGLAFTSRGGMEDGEEGKLDPSAPDGSQRYLCQVGTRALVYIRARDTRLGTVVFVAVGMAEVSSCEVTVREGDVVEKGQEIGMFHYGGSTHCLIFEPGVRLKFIEAAERGNGSTKGQNLPVNGYLAEIV